jgi:hypothetical protein
MFTKPKPYTIQDVNAAIDGLTQLEKLQDKTEQTLRLNYTKMNQDTVTDFKQRYERYSMNIASRQRLIQYMQEKMVQP